MANPEFNARHMRVIASAIRDEVDLIGKQRAAGTLSQQVAIARLSSTRRIALGLAHIMEAGNPNFNMSRYLSVCGFPSDTVSQQTRRSS